MEPAQFFYSLNGADVQGPVTDAALRVLVQTKVLGPGSYYCREGDSEWKPCVMEAAPAPVIEEDPDQLPAYVPTAEALERMKMPETEGRMPEFLRGVFLVLAVGGSGMLTLMNATRASSHAQILASAGWFLAHLAAVAGLPYLVSLLFRLSLRNLIRVAGAISLCLLIYAGHTLQAIYAPPVTETVSLEADAEPQQEIGLNDESQAGMRELNALQDSAVGDTQDAKIARDLIAVHGDLIAKVQASQALEKACNVNTSTITGIGDIEHRLSALKDLHDSQSEVITFLKNYNDSARKAMTVDNFDAQVVIDGIERGRKVEQIDLLIELWRVNQKLTDDHSARLDFLEKQWGHWSVKEGKLLFEDEDTLGTYNRYSEILRGDVRQIQSVQSRIFRAGDAAAPAK